MSDFLQEHKTLATVVVILVAVGVVLLLFVLSGHNPPNSAGTTSYAPVVAHGQDGPVIPGSTSVTTAAGIRQADFQSLLSADLADGQQLDAPLYFDMNSDGFEEALLIAHGSGDTHPVDWFVFGTKNGQTVKLFERTRVAQGQVSVQGPMIVETEGVYGSGDPECCPSAAKRTYYVWKGDGLVASRIEAVPPGAAS